MNNRDIFQSTLTDQTALLQGFETDIRKHLHDNQICLRRDIHAAASDTRIANLHEHHETRVIVQAEGDRILTANAVSLQTFDAHVQATIESRAEEDSFQHQQTQRHIADLQSQLLQLSEQIKQRDREFRKTLVSIEEATSTKKRKLLRERSNAIAATILASQIMSSHSQVCLHLAENTDLHLIFI
jgi:chromosome segregation ATPase